MALTYKFQAKLWVYPGDAAWYFITLPQEYASEIKSLATIPRRGFGSLRVEATIGKSAWQTSIFPGTKSKSYVLPIKKEIRIQNKLVNGKKVNASITLTDI